VRRESKEGGGGVAGLFEGGGGLCSYGTHKRLRVSSCGYEDVGPVGLAIAARQPQAAYERGHTAC